MRAIQNPIPIAEDAQRARLEVCAPCDKYVNGRCLECGCVMELKVKFAHMECPLGKWGKHTGG